VRHPLLRAQEEHSGCSLPGRPFSLIMGLTDYRDGISLLPDQFPYYGHLLKILLSEIKPYQAPLSQKAAYNLGNAIEMPGL
jgi:hypothetical protein